MNKYQNGKIYKIISPNTEKIYIGSTIVNLNKRLIKHRYEIKKRGITSKIIFDAGDEKIELIKNFPCNSKEELRREEGLIMKQYKNICVNILIAGRTRKEYYTDNFEKIKIIQKKYYLKNKDKTDEYQRQYKIDNKERLSSMKKEKFNCECGGRYTRYTKKEHERSGKHKYFIENGIPKYEFTKSNKKIKCKCGGEYTEKFQNAHFKSKIHKYFIENGKPFIKPIPKCKSTKLIKCPCGGQYTEKYERGHKRQLNHKKYLQQLNKS